jgi:hypothetical protein
MNDVAASIASELFGQDREGWELADGPAPEGWRRARSRVSDEPIYLSDTSDLVVQVARRPRGQRPALCLLLLVPAASIDDAREAVGAFSGGRTFARAELARRGDHVLLAYRCDG